MKKFLMVFGLCALTTNAMAQNWVKVPQDKKGVNIYYDFDTLVTRMDGKNRYLQAKVKRVYDAPKKTTKGTIYTHYYYKLSVDCNLWKYATSETMWAVNGKSASDGSGNYSWRDITSDTTDAEATAVCDI